MTDNERIQQLELTCNQQALLIADLQEQIGMIIKVINQLRTLIGMGVK